MAATEFLKNILMNSPNLKAYYRCEAGALTVDSSGNGKTLTNVNSVGENTGMFGGCADPGTNTNKELKILDNFGIGGASNMSMGGWFKMNADISSGAVSFMGHRSTLTVDGYCGIYYEYNSGNRRIGIKGNYNVAGFYNVSLGTTRHHFVLTRVGNGAYKLYFDGVHVSSCTLPASALGQNAFGFCADIGQEFASVQADDVFITADVLTAEQVKELYEGRSLGEIRPQSNLELLYHFNNDLLTDYSGNTRNLTKGGTVNLVDGRFGKGVNANFNYTNTLGVNMTAPGTGSFTMGCWFKKNGAPTVDYSPVVLNYGGNGNRFDIVAGKNTGVGYILSYDGNYTNTTGVKNICDNKWHFLCAIRSGTDHYMIIDNDVYYVSGTARNVPGARFVVGGHEDVGNYDTIGDATYDEIFLISAARTPNWARKQYAISKYGHI